MVGRKPIMALNVFLTSYRFRVSLDIQQQKGTTLPHNRRISQEFGTYPSVCA
jgi:hypothetical protein